LLKPRSIFVLFDCREKRIIIHSGGESRNNYFTVREENALLWFTIFPQVFFDVTPVYGWLRPRTG